MTDHGTAGAVPLLVLSVLNNSTVLASQGNRQVVVTGRGVGWGLRLGDPVDPTKIVKVFVPDTSATTDYLTTYLQTLEPASVDLAVAMVKEASRVLNRPLRDSLIIPIADHVQFALERAANGTSLELPLASEVAYLYPAELQAAEAALRVLQARSEAPLPKGEEVAIALHLVNEQFTTGDLSQTFRMTKVVNAVLDLIEQGSGITIDPRSLNTARFVTHLRYFFVRHAGEKFWKGSDAMARTIRDSFPEHFALAQKAALLLEMHLGGHIGLEETSYLTLHIARLLEEDR